MKISRVSNYISNILYGAFVVFLYGYTEGNVKSALEFITMFVIAGAIVIGTLIFFLGVEEG